MLAGATLDTDDLSRLVDAVAGMRSAADDAERIERIRQFENLKSALAAAQAKETAEFVSSRRAAQAAAGVPVTQQGRGIAGEIGLARRISPWSARRYAGWCTVLTRELPRTCAALREGLVTEWQAMLVARETIWLSRTDREAVDQELAPSLERWGDRAIEAAARKAAYRLDPRGAVERAGNAAKDRRVTLRPAPDVMARLTALVPVAYGVAAYKSLCDAADSTTAAGDERGRGQIMADTLVERITGQAGAAAVAVEIELVMTDRTLLGAAHPGARSADSGEARAAGPGDLPTAPDAADGGHDEPAELVGYGPIPGEVARRIALEALGDRWLRRLFRHPVSGQLAAMESSRRYFTDNERLFIRLRDHTCRTPWCDAPIRHTDHLVPYARGGPTTTANGAGACAACNYAKQAAGWSTLPESDGSITVVTPTGHRYVGRPPDPPGKPHRADAPTEPGRPGRRAA